MQFFTSPEDLKGWVKSNPDSAANKIKEMLGGNDELSVNDSCKTILESTDPKIVDNASEILHGILAKYNYTQIKTSNNGDKMKKTAQMMRQDSLYGNMPTRICPKLPASSGKKLISTYNCRHYCLDSITFDDDPNRVYCAEALWRNHVMDKFSREWKDKDGHWIGGYINERFQVTHDDGGNNMQLANGERTRLPREHQYSTERRLNEARGEETKDITLLAKNNGIVKLASTKKEELKESKESNVYQIFDDIVEMRLSGISEEDIIFKVSEHYKKAETDVALLLRCAKNQMTRNSGKIYGMQKISATSIPQNSTLISKSDVEIISLEDGQKKSLKMGTPVVKTTDGDSPVFQIIDGPDINKKFKLVNSFNMDSYFDFVDDSDKDELIQDAANELGLNEEKTESLNQTIEPKLDDFPIKENVKQI